jgi:heme A synthase
LNQDDTLRTWFHRFDFVIGIVAVVLAAWWIWRHIGHLRKEKEGQQDPA